MKDAPACYAASDCIVTNKKVQSNINKRDIKKKNSLYTFEGHEAALTSS